MPDLDEMQQRLAEMERIVMRLQSTVIGMSEILGSLIEYVEGEDDLTRVEFSQH